MFSAIDAVPLTAIPFFMLTGELMSSASITDRLVELSRRMIGRMRGSMAQANVLVSMFFAGMNGSVVADTATVGSLLIPAMKRAGYPPAFAAAVTAVSSTIGGIIPPSIMMIVLANAGGISVGALFAGGIIPGVMIGILIMVINYFIARKNNFERSEEPFSLKAVAIASYKSSFALLIPIVLVGSVVFGIAGVVEAGALTATIALFVGLFIYKTITWENCKGAFIRAFRNSAMVFIIIAASGPFSWLLTSLGAITDLEQWLLSYTHSPLLFILVLVMFICLLGMVMDSAANIIVAGPVLVDVMIKAGYPDVQAALVVVVGFLIGSVTPPVGVAFFTAGAIAKVRLEKVAVAMLPYLVALFFLLFILIVVPQFTMFLPEVLGFVK
jgi:tripartite ATP-independent transporter DctM subunit